MTGRYVQWQPRTHDSRPCIFREWWPLNRAEAARELDSNELGQYTQALREHGYDVWGPPETLDASITLAEARERSLVAALYNEEVHA